MSTTRSFSPKIKTGFRAVAFALLLAMVPATMSCYGRFPLTHAVYRFNGDVSDHKVVKTLVFWVFWLLPVYWFAILGDAVIFNLIEFWTGETLEVSQGMTKDGGTYTLVPSPDQREAVLTIYKDGQMVTKQTFTKTTDNTFEVRDERGIIGGYIVHDATGGLRFLDGERKEVRSIPGSALSQLHI